MSTHDLGCGWESGGLDVTRRQALAGALALATLAVVLIGFWSKSVAEQASSSVETSTVLVAREAVDVGTPVAQARDSFEVRQVPGSAVPEGALADLGGMAGQVVAVPILPGQVVQQAMIGSSASAGGLPIKKEHLGVSVRLDDPERVAGFVRPGSQVAILATVVGSGGDRITRVLLDRVDVAAVGPTTAVATASGTGDDKPVPAAILTLSVNQAQAQKLVFAQTAGDLYFALLTQDSVVSTRTRGVTDKNLFD
ncbi:MAG: Flp pilus assembly protein CpaB [Candidatus Nanopelagicales bacterium]|nr:Flp pilus assembly protein CpaB [Candidatus Nanopelagicales bacterium]